MPHQPPIGVTVRCAHSPDAAALAELCAQLGYPSGADEIAERLAALGQRTDSIVYVAEVGQQVIGWVQAVLLELLIAPRCVEIGGLVVTEQHRGKGIGRQLMAAVEQWARAQGCAEVCLRSNVTRKDAHCFYEALGYQCIKTSFTFRKGL